LKLLGVDTGGTFTDFVYLDEAGMRVHKVLSTPEAPERAILQGIREMGLDGEGLKIVHGSTVATNALLEGKGARTAYITNRGFGDVLTIGRQARDDIYDLQPPPKRPPVPPELCLETGGRLSAGGEVLDPLTGADLESLTDRLRELAPNAVAINLLFSYLDDGPERAIEAAVPEGIFVSRSSAVLPETGEYERGIATWLNSYVGPLMGRYLAMLRSALPRSHLSVMQSHGGAIDSAQAAGHAAQLLLSGPAGGLAGARHVGSGSRAGRLLTLDMGGTSTDVALIDHDISLTSEGRIAGYPVAVPMVDMHTIGAGGGSIARVDEGGLLQVGPESAGAAPGPACYGRGGDQATVTDANLVLGRLPPTVALAGGMGLEHAAAAAAVDRLAATLGMTRTGAAEGIVRVVNEHMAQALRVISVQKGIDPREYVLMSFGGAGGLHACDLAEALGMSTAIAPVHSGVLSALGMLVAPPGRQLSQAVNTLLDSSSDAEVVAGLDRLAERGKTELRAEGVEDIRRVDQLDLRYEGQSYTLRAPWMGAAKSTDAFHQAHRDMYGHALDIPVELVNLRVGLGAAAHPPDLPPARVADGSVPAPCGTTRVVGEPLPVPIYERRRLCVGHRLQGPAVVIEPVATTWIASGWRLEVDAIGNLLLKHGAA
jgi:N-methylhydantoinase A